MKRLIYILLLVISWNTLTAQTYQVNNQKIRFMNALGIPAKDTAAANWANAADTSIILIRPGDSTLWYRYKGSFRKVGTGGGTAIVDTVNTISSKPWRQKGIDSVTALISPRITDSLRSLVRLRASGSGGIQLQNSVGTNVADFGIANTTNGSIAGGWNVGGNSTISGTLGVTQKATFSDSIVGVNQRLAGNMLAASFSSSGANYFSYQLLGRSSDNLGAFGFYSNDGATRYGYIQSASSNGGQLFLVGDGGGQLILDSRGTIVPQSTGLLVGPNNRAFIKQNVSGDAELGGSTGALTYIFNNGVNALSFNSSNDASFVGNIQATAQGNNITVGVDSSVTSTSYTLVLGDAGYLKRCSNASAITITVPTNASVAFPIGTTIYFSQQGAGKVSVSPATSDVTIQSEGSLLGTAGQHAVIGLIKVNTNRWLLVGNRG